MFAFKDLASCKLRVVNTFILKQLHRYNGNPHKDCLVLIYKTL